MKRDARKPARAAKQSSARKPIGTEEDTPTEIQRWITRIKAAEKIRDDADQKHWYSASKELYESSEAFRKVMPKFIKNADLVPINQVFSYVRNFVPSVYSRDPDISLAARGKKSIGGAKMLESAINSYWDELRLKKEIRRVIYDAVFAEGWIKVGCTSAYGKVEPKDGKTMLYPNEFYRDEELFCTRVSWKDMVRDPRSVDGIHDARWIAQRMYLPLQAVLDSDLYDRARGDLQPTHRVQDDVPRVMNYYAEIDEDYVEVWEIYDRDTGLVYAASDAQTDDWLWTPKKWPLILKRNPYNFELLRFCDNPDECYGPNLIANWLPQLFEKIKIRSMQLDHLKRFNRQMAAEENSMDDKNLADYERGTMGAVIFYKAGKKPPEPINYPPIQPDIYAIESKNDLDMDNISGQPNIVRSAPQQTKTRTLGELREMLGTYNNRQMDPQSIVEDFSSEVAYKLIVAIQQYLPADKFIAATARDAQEVIQAFGQDVFDGTGFIMKKKYIQKIEFDVKIRSGSMLPLDRERRMAAISDILGRGQFLGFVPGGETTLTLGRQMMADMELLEVEQAFEDEILNRQNQQALALMHRLATVNNLGDRIKGMQDQIKQGMTPDVNAAMGGGGGGPTG